MTWWNEGRSNGKWDVPYLPIDPEDIGRAVSYTHLDVYKRQVFLGGTKNHLRIMVDAPKDVNIVRSTVLENRVTDPEEKACLLYTS